MTNNPITFCVFCKGTFEEPQPTDKRIDCSCGESFAVRTYVESKNESE